MSVVYFLCLNFLSQHLSKCDEVLEFCSEASQLGRYYNFWHRTKYIWLILFTKKFTNQAAELCKLQNTHAIGYTYIHSKYMYSIFSLLFQKMLLPLLDCILLSKEYLKSVLVVGETMYEISKPFGAGCLWRAIVMIFVYFLKVNNLSVFKRIVSCTLGPLLALLLLF